MCLVPNADFPTPNSIFLRRSALEIQTVHPECLRDPPAGALEPFLLTACCFSNLPGTWLPPLPLLGPLSGKRSDSRLISFRSLLKCHFLREVIFTLSKIASPPSVILCLLILFYFYSIPLISIPILHTLFVVYLLFSPLAPQQELSSLRVDAPSILFITVSLVPSTVTDG